MDSVLRTYGGGFLFNCPGHMQSNCSFCKDNTQTRRRLGLLEFNTKADSLIFVSISYLCVPFPQVELLILSHHFYKSSACLDGVDVLVALAANKVDSYVTEGDFSCLARLITGVGNFYALNFILGILIENGQLDLLLRKYSAAADVNSSAAESVRGFRMAVITALKQFNPNDLDAVAMVRYVVVNLLPYSANKIMQFYIGSSVNTCGIAFVFVVLLHTWLLLTSFLDILQLNRCTTTLT